MTVHAEPTHALTTNAAVVALTQTLPPGETVRFAERAVVVTEHYARLNFMTYQIADIVGVQLDEQTLNQSVVVVIMIFGMLLAVIVASLSLLWAVGFVGISGLLAWAMRRAAPSTYTLRLTLSDGDHDVLMARDRAYLVRIVEALNTARDAAHPHDAMVPV